MLSKRIRFIFSSVILSMGFVGIGFLEDRMRFLGILILVFFTFLFFVWSLWEGLGINASLLSLILPVFFTLGVGLFGFCCL
jgi:hypothetical protein